MNLDGDSHHIFEKLYNIFKNDFINNKCYFEGMEVEFDSRKIDSEYEEGFWHVVSNQYGQTKRDPDYKRAKRLHWIKLIIENPNAENVIRFEEPVIKNGKTINNKRKIYLWAKDVKFVVILQINYDEFCILLTAFKVYPKKGMEFEEKIKK